MNTKAKVDTTRTSRMRAIAVGTLWLGCSLIAAHAASWVTAWGDNQSQQCSVPPGPAEPLALAAGEAHSLALTADGTVLAWGFNGFGQATVPLDLANVVAVSAGGSYSLALKADGHVVMWGSHTPTPAGLSGVSAIAAGYDHCLALKQDGTVVSWGSDTYVPPGMSNVVSIAAGTSHSMALLVDGTVRAWGDDSFFKTNVPPGLSNVTAIAAGRDHCLALKRDGTVAAWGAHYAGQIAVPPGLTNVVSIAAGALHNLALLNDGTLIGWGDNSFTQSETDPGQTNFVAIAAGARHSLALYGVGTPAVVMEPHDRTVFAGHEVTFEVRAIGLEPFTYQWLHNGVSIEGATNAVLVLTNPQLADAGQYAVRIENAIGTRISRSATLTLLMGPPAFVVEPPDQVIICGQDLSFQTVLEGSAPFVLQWYFNGQALPDGTNMDLVISNATPAVAGTYWLTALNPLGSAISRTAIAHIASQAPQIVSTLDNVRTDQGQEFEYQIEALHGVKGFSATGLPEGLEVDPVTGLISGMPLESGYFAPLLGAQNDCGWGLADLNLYVYPADVRPSYGSASATEGEYVEIYSSYWYYYDYLPYFLPGRIPPGMSVTSDWGDVIGTPTAPGDYAGSVICTNEWGTNVGTFMLYVSNRVISGLSMSEVSYNYSAPYLLDFQFTLRDELDLPVVTNPRFLSAECTENGQPISPTESGSFTDRISAKSARAFLVLDFTLSMSSLSNGDSNTNGISDAVEWLVASAQEFVAEQSSNTLIGVYEFHRDDAAPQKVMDLTTDQDSLNQAIAGIWTNYVHDWPAGSRCWDALQAAIEDMGSPNPDEYRIIVCVSDGNDDSSNASLDDVIAAALTNEVKVSCLGFGNELTAATLQQIAAETGGKYFTATTPDDLQTQFGLLSRETKGHYALRWPTMKRVGDFAPWFQISFQGFTASPPDDVVFEDTNAPPIIDTNSVPPITNYPLVTNLTFERFAPTQYVSDVTVGSLRLVPEAVVRPPAIVLRATYIPRYVRQFKIHYRPNWPCTVGLLSTGTGELLSGWSLTETDDGAGGKWLLISSPNPQYISNSLPFAAFGNLVRFAFRDLQTASNTFSFFEMDNSIYSTTGGQSFELDPASLTAFVTEYEALPYQTPVPWLIEHGISSGFQQAELADPDADGVATWREFRANTDPQDPASRLVISQLWRRPNNRFDVTFTTATNRLYNLESSTNLVNWQTNIAGIKGVSGSLTITDPTARPALQPVFFRVSAY